MARGLISGSIDDLAGNARAGVSVTIRSRVSGLPATVYGASLGGSSVSNPVVTNASGRFSVWAERGAYSVDVPAGSGVPAYTRFVEATPGSDGTADSAWLQPFSLSPTTLPLVPYPDQRAKVAVSASSVVAGTVMDSGTTWEFQWDALISRWRFVGGAPLSLTITGWPELTSVSTLMSVNLPATGDYQMLMTSAQGVAGVWTSTDWYWRQAGVTGSKLLRNTGYSDGAYGYSNLAGFATMSYSLGSGPAVVQVNKWGGTDLNNVAVTLTFFILPTYALYT